MIDQSTLTAEQKMLKNMSDKELTEFTGTVYNDLAIAAETQRNSEWHESCFAALLMCSYEMNDRGLKLDVK